MRFCFPVKRCPLHVSVVFPPVGNTLVDVAKLVLCTVEPSNESQFDLTVFARGCLERFSNRMMDAIRLELNQKLGVGSTDSSNIISRLSEISQQAQQDILDDGGSNALPSDNTPSDNTSPVDTMAISIPPPVEYDVSPEENNGEQSLLLEHSGEQSSTLPEQWETAF